MVKKTPYRSAKSLPKAPPKPKPKPAPKQPAEPTSAPAPPLLPLNLQQSLLNLFNTSFSAVLSSPSLPALLQSTKEALYARDFDAAFARASQESLEAYAARWSPTRALGYASVLVGLDSHLKSLERQIQVPAGPDSGSAPAVSENEEPHGDEPAARDDRQPTASIKILALGGGAAELAASAAILSLNPSLHASVHLLDSAPWSAVTGTLLSAIVNPPPLSKYASAATKASNAALVSSASISSTFSQLNMLDLSRDEWAGTMGGESLLVTLLFTLNELYTSAGIGKTTSFLLNLTATIPDGSLLLVVDSPGSYSEAAVGKESKKYPMQWLLDHTLVKDEPVEGCLWEKVDSHDSVWFRLADSLQYPISLENMRYQMHLYRATRP
ncbi:25S rRNA (uridine(2843)-N(3))-methyltransferase [Colletotrichum sidae]|uniref:25S rRNA (Uridine(2843)-N(3))-methyltransferase n=1 Tax=Colletotrichum sidae TaxID=1347389 RepID=A0A4R8TCB9_9PEZI|nr:25S rRNA (uridine(2843)-N(3))-methyltransferase [Colletotrichum sidae]